jgi:3-phosphoshikimate 1-carboxyvinyltransferase
MGADIELRDEREVGGEPVADILVRGADLHGIEIPQQEIPLAIDEFPALFIAAACAEGRTVLRGAEELRVKESDRIAAMAEGLNTLGVNTEVLEDGIIIDGFGTGGSFTGGVVNSHHDHRIAMSFAIAALRAHSEIRVMDADNVATSFPGFDVLAGGLGLQISAAD